MRRVIPHTRRALARCAAALTAFAVAACSPYKAPTLTVADAKATQETDAGLALAFTLDARNENNVALPLREVRYELDISDSDQDSSLKRVFTGIRSPEASIRRLGEQPVVLPTVIRLRDENGNPLPRPVGIHAFRLWTKLTYITPGALAEVLFDTGVRRPDVTITQTGRLDFGPGPGAPVTLLPANP